MPTVSAGNLTLLRAPDHRSEVYTSFLVPPILWKARINDGSIVQGETAIDFNAGTGSFFSFIEGIQEVWVGTTDGDKDVGRLRIRGISSGDAGVTGTVTVAGHSLPLQDAQYLTFLHHYPLRPRYSYLDYDTDSWYMDIDIDYTDQHEEPPPVVIAGDHRAGFLDDAPEMVINVDSSNSYAIASGASISSYALSVASTAGAPTVNFNTGTGLGDITFTLPGYYWAKYTVTDSNGKSQNSYRCYFVCERDRSSAWYPFVDAKTIELTGDWEEGGWIATIDAKANYSLDEIPDHTLAVIWRESYYGTTLKNITYLPDQSSTIFAGYVRDDTEEMDLAEGAGVVDLMMGTIESKLRQIYSFSASIVAQQGSVDDWFEGPNWMTVGIIAHFLMRWRSTLFEVADVIGLDTNTLKRPGFEPDDSNLYDMVNTFTLDEGIRAKLVCDQGGRMHLAYDIQLLTDSERGALSTVFDIKKDPDAGDYGGTLTIPRQPENEVPFITSDGTYWDGTTYDADGRPEATGDWCVIAPGGVGLEEGPTPKDFPRQAISSLLHLREIAGRFLAKTNNPIEEVRIPFSGDYLGVLDVAYDDAVWTISLQAGDTPRGEVWTDKPLYCRNIVARFRGDEEGGIFIVNAAFEAEADGITGVETECPGFPLLGGEIPEIPLPTEQPGALMTGSSVHFKSVSGNAWDKRIAEDVLDLRADPFWRAKQGTSSPSAAILFMCGVGYIKRTTDAFVTTDVDITPSNDPPNDAGDSPAPTATGVTYHQMGSSWINQDTFIFLARWQNGSGEWRSWVAYTDDNGTTYSWKYLPVDPDCIQLGTKSDSFNDDGYRTYNLFSWHRGTPLIQVSSTKYVICYIDSTVGGLTYVQAFSLAGDTVTWGNAVNIGSPAITFFNYAHICYVDNEKFALLHRYDTGAPLYDYRLSARIGTLSGVTISLGAEGHLRTDDEITDDVGHLDYATIASPDSSTVIVLAWGLEVQADCTESSDYGWKMIWGGISGSTVAFNTTSCNGKLRGDWYFTVQGLNSSEWGQSMSIKLGSEVLFFYRLGDTVVSRHWYVVGAGAANGVKSSPVPIGTYIYDPIYPEEYRYPDVFYACPLTATKAFVCWNEFHEWRNNGGFDSENQLHAAVITMSGINPTVRTDNLLETNYWYYADIYVCGMTANKVAFGASLQSDSCNKLMIMDISTYTVTIAERCPFSQANNGMIKQTDTKFMMMGYNAPINNHGVMWTGITEAMIADCGGLGDSLALGLALGKSVGNVAWVTFADGGNLELLEITLPGLAIANRFDLGAATTAEVLAQIRVAYPFIPFGYDDVIYIFGNMDDPQSLGDPAHVIRTINGGTSFTLIENGWGVDHCGAVIVTTGNYMYAIRNRGAQSKLYRDNADNVLVVKLTLPFAAEVVHHGILVDYRNSDVYVCANSADPIMVVKIPPPHLVARDITYDHEAIEGIYSIVGL